MDTFTRGDIVLVSITGKPEISGRIVNIDGDMACVDESAAKEVDFPIGDGKIERRFHEGDGIRAWVPLKSLIRD